MTHFGHTRVPPDAGRPRYLRHFAAQSFQECLANLDDVVRILFTLILLNLVSGCRVSHHREVQNVAYH